LDLEIYVTEEEKKDITDSSIGLESIIKIKVIIHTGSLGSSPNWSEGKYLLLIKEILSLQIPN